MRNIVQLIKKAIEHPDRIITNLEKYGCLKWMKDETYLKLVYRLAIGRKLHLERPETFTEKLNWYKLNWRDPLAQKCADKYEVRAYVEQVVGKKYLNECLGVWNDVEDIDVTSLPDKFVLKPTNGSGDVVICTDKNRFSMDEAKKVLTQHSKHHFAYRTKEWAYYDLPYRVIAERYIESSDNYQVKDYKFFCFHGEPRFMYVASERGKYNLKLDFFDMEWNRIPMKQYLYENNPFIEKPQFWDEMIEVSRKLSKAFPFVRVDLYEEEGKVYFGELTFYPTAGFAKYEPDQWDYEFGKFFDMTKMHAEKECIK